MKPLGTLGLLLVACPLCVIPAVAHAGCHHGHGYRDCDGWGFGCEGRSQWEARPAPGSRAALRSPASTPADPTANFEALEGKIAEVIYLPGMNPAAGMVELLVATGEQPTLVRLAPAGFLERHTLLLKEGEDISLTGYRVRTADGDLIVAVQLRSDGQTVNLRNSRGRSLW